MLEPIFQPIITFPLIVSCYDGVRGRPSERHSTRKQTQVRGHQGNFMSSQLYDLKQCLGAILRSFQHTLQIYSSTKTSFSQRDSYVPPAASQQVKKLWQCVGAPWFESCLRHLTTLRPLYQLEHTISFL